MVTIQVEHKNFCFPDVFEFSDIVVLFVKHFFFILWVLEVENEASEFLLDFIDINVGSPQDLGDLLLSRVLNIHIMDIG